MTIRLNRLLRLPCVRWVLTIGALIRAMRRSTRAFLDADRALRLTVAFERLDAALARRTPEEPHTHTITSLEWLKSNGEVVPLHPMHRCDMLPAYGMKGGPDTVEPLNLEGWMQLHAKEIGWDGRIVADPTDRD